MSNNQNQRQRHTTSSPCLLQRQCEGVTAQPFTKPLETINAAPGQATVILATQQHEEIGNDGKHVHFRIAIKYQTDFNLFRLY